MDELKENIDKRRTFAIISHPDAGKTTLTEKLLLYGGAIHLAGSVKARKADRHAVSDWMEIEKQRGISVTSSVLQFDYDGYRVNILDTPGHQDFSEDTYRTLMAADSAVMLIDAAKGVEPQTKKLFWVCHRRHLPIFTFINKLDRYGREPLDLMEEVEKVLQIRVYPITWPVGIDGHYKGIYNRITKQVSLFKSDASHGSKQLEEVTADIGNPIVRELIGDELFENLKNDIELLDMAGEDFSMDDVGKGDLTPMFFGSAMTNFGVQEFLERFLKMSPAPQPRTLQDGEIIQPDNPMFSAFVFKIQANMNPAHRIFARVEPRGCLKRKQFEKGIIQLSQEGAIQVFRQKHVGLESFIVGVVGQLQLEVLEYRLKNEYNAQLAMTPLPFTVARWVCAENPESIEKLKGLDNGMLVYDKKDRPVVLVNNEWALNWILQRNPDLQFLVVPADKAMV